MTLWQFIIQLIVELGGLTGITIAVVKFFGKAIIENLTKRYENELTKDLELFKASIDGKSYVSKEKFDIKFRAYSDLSKLINLCFEGIWTITPDNQIIDDDSINIIEIKGNVDALKKLKLNYALEITDELGNKLEELLKMFMHQLNAYTSIHNDLEFDDISFYSLDDFVSKKESIIRIIRDSYDNLEVLPMDK